MPRINQIYGIFDVNEVVISFLYLKLLHIFDTGYLDFSLEYNEGK